MCACHAAQSGRTRQHASWSQIWRVGGCGGPTPGPGRGQWAWSSLCSPDPRASLCEVFCPCRFSAPHRAALGLACGWLPIGRSVARSLFSLPCAGPRVPQTLPQALPLPRSQRWHVPTLRCWAPCSQGWPLASPRSRAHTPGAHLSLGSSEEELPGGVTCSQVPSLRSGKRGEPLSLVAVLPAGLLCPCPVLDSPLLPFELRQRFWKHPRAQAWGCPVREGLAWHQVWAHNTLLWGRAPQRVT